MINIGNHDLVTGDLFSPGMSLVDDTDGQVSSTLMTGYNITFMYDPTYIQFVSAESGHAFQGETVFDVGTTSNSVTIHEYKIDTVPEIIDFDIAKIDFQAINPTPLDGSTKVYIKDWSMQLGGYSWGYSEPQLHDTANILFGYGYYPDTTVKIMPLGDSITAQSYSYREKLWNLLEQDGIQTDFVGSQSSGSILDTNHEGHPGWSTWQLTDPISSWIKEYDPDIVLLHIGTNDVNNALHSNSDLSRSKVALEELIDTIYRLSPSQKIGIYIATTIPSKDCWMKCGQAALTRSWNTQVRAVISAKAAEGKPVYLVDMETEAGIDVNTDLGDAVHVARSGADKMADVWYRHLRIPNVSQPVNPIIPPDVIVPEPTATQQPDFLDLLLAEGHISNRTQLPPQNSLNPDQVWQTGSHINAWIDILGWNNMTFRDGTYYIPANETPIIQYGYRETGSNVISVNCKVSWHDSNNPPMGSITIPQPTPVTTRVGTPEQPNTGDGVTVNPDKTININGIKTFPVYIYSLCHYSYPSSDCTPDEAPEFTYSTIERYPDVAAWIPRFELTNVLWVRRTSDVYNNAQPPLSNDQKNSPNLFGYYQYDEPTYGMHSSLVSLYQTTKTADPDHPVVTNLCYPENPQSWQDTADIVTYDRYSIRPTSEYLRQDAIYDWELRAKTLGPLNIPTHQLSKPFYMVIQANGRDAPCCLTPLAAEIKALVYTAISMDVQGVGFWKYKIPYGGGDIGLSSNPALLRYVRQLASELKSLNDILVLPTYAHAWYGEPDWTSVSFSPNPTKRVEGALLNKLSYMLKKDNAANKWYLFVVNKDSSQIQNIKITVAGLVGFGETIASTIGLETTGSQRAGRIIQVANGAFTDSFDGYAAHIYEIPSEIPSQNNAIISSNTMPLPDVSAISQPYEQAINTADTIAQLDCDVRWYTRHCRVFGIKRVCWNVYHDSHESFSDTEQTPEIFPDIYPPVNVLFKTINVTYYVSKLVEITYNHSVYDRYTVDLSNGWFTKIDRIWKINQTRKGLYYAKEVLLDISRSHNINHQASVVEVPDDFEISASGFYGNTNKVNITKEYQETNPITQFLNPVLLAFVLILYSVYRYIKKVRFL